MKGMDCLQIKFLLKGVTVATSLAESEKKNNNNNNNNWLETGATRKQRIRSKTDLTVLDCQLLFSYLCMYAVILID